MKKIIISLAAGLVIGYGVSTAMENSEITNLEAENVKAQQQVAKLSEQLLAAQKQPKQPKHASRIAQRTKPKTLSSGGLNKSSRTKEQMLAQRKQAMERMRTQQLTAQKNITEQAKNQVKTLDNGTVL
ncbi:hypothetical protein RGQ13_17585 [Thalassotalea psychrophila]|uniref:Uncharacterized protein n=1 Tax=Thalassotalea psychrophila TaxID=3065647 RepID=A0ABY9TSX4_9GAMM|nr:hypothetical protein RGQ13_17585 [Colwelliaceae bacterium SQ149]